jgi:hypothetical protein
MISLGPAIPYYSRPCGRPTPGQPNSHPEVDRPQGNFSISVFKPSLETPRGAAVIVARREAMQRGVARRLAGYGSAVGRNRPQTGRDLNSVSAGAYGMGYPRG